MTIAPGMLLSIISILFQHHHHRAGGHERQRSTGAWPSRAR
ncbi:MAG: hypothetical protein ACLTDR_05780 [Adlercreutzia equolifaciens]